MAWVGVTHLEEGFCSSGAWTWAAKSSLCNLTHCYTLRFRVLDECDEMLNMGFVDDVEKILNAGGSQKIQVFNHILMNHRQERKH